MEFLTSADATVRRVQHEIECAAEHLRELAHVGYVDRNCLYAFVRAECERLHERGFTVVWQRSWQIVMSTIVSDLVCKPLRWHSMNPEEWLTLAERRVGNQVTQIVGERS